jgi:hypothetical protein
VVSAQAYLAATNWILWASAMLMLALVPLIGFARPPFVARRG